MHPNPAPRAGGNVTARPAAKQKNSVITRRKPHQSDVPGATVDEVVADLSRDPRRDDD